MKVGRLARQLREIWEVPRDLVLGRYPAFVTGGPLQKGEIPVFVFHSLEPVSFERKLRHLRDNGYRTLGADEYLEALTGTRPFPDRGVVLSFDDGRGSLWGVGAPLLRRHGMCGVVFLVPARVRSRPGPLPPNWDDVLGQRAPAREVLEREAGEGALLSWEEIEALSRKGTLEFQSHTLSHARIHTAPRLAGFMSPAGRHPYRALDVPWIRDGTRDLWAHEVPLGTPLLESAPRTSESLRFLEDTRIRAAPVSRVGAEGGEAFFARAGWEKRLWRMLAGCAIDGRFETPDERETALRREFQLGRDLIQERTGRRVTHLCYPWHTAGPTARRLAEEAGYRTAFCGKLRGVPITPVNGDPLAVARIGEDYVERLPGRGRASLASVLREKWRRRLAALP